MQTTTDQEGRIQGIDTSGSWICSESADVLDVFRMLYSFT